MSTSSAMRRSPPAPRATSSGELNRTGKVAEALPSQSSRRLWMPRKALRARLRLYSTSLSRYCRENLGRKIEPFEHLNDVRLCDVGIFQQRDQDCFIAFVNQGTQFAFAGPKRASGCARNCHPA